MTWLRATVSDRPAFAALTEQLRLDVQRCAQTSATPRVYASFATQELVCNDVALALFDSILSLEHLEVLPELPAQVTYVRLSPVTPTDHSPPGSS